MAPIKPWLNFNPFFVAEALCTTNKWQTWSQKFSQPKKFRQLQNWKYVKNENNTKEENFIENENSPKNKDETKNIDNLKCLMKGRIGTWFATR